MRLGQMVMHPKYGIGRIDSEVERGRCWLAFMPDGVGPVDVEWVHVEDCEPLTVESEFENAVEAALSLARSV